MKKQLITFLFCTLLFEFSLAQKNPDDFLGVQVGSDQTLVKYPEIVNYFQYLGNHSRRIKVVIEGKTTLGNSMILAFISSEENIRTLPDLVEINKKLANPDTITTEEAKELINKARTFVLITCALHATEIASSQMAMLFAHQLAKTSDPLIRSYLDKVVILLMPSINPDGNIMVTEWYNKYINTEFEGCRMPYLYHHYAGHDNNRDFYMLNLKESRVVNAVLHQRYFPQVFLDLHQMFLTGPRMFVPPFKDPLNQNLDPLLINQTNIIGGFMALRLQENKKKGVGSAYAFDAYWPGGSKNTAWFKNVVGVLTEMASARVASPVYIEPNELRVSSKGLPEYKAQVNFPDPWPGGWWHFRDIIDYELIAVNALLEIAAKNRHSFMTNFYRLGLKNIHRGNNKPPYGYAIPLSQWDKPSIYTFMKKMEAHGIRIYTLQSDACLGDQILKRGDFIIPLNQPYRSFIKVMMEIQHYPEIRHMKDGPIMEPYDSAGWTMPLQMGLKTIALNNPCQGLPLIRTTNIDYPTETISGRGNTFCIPSRYNRSFLVVNRLLEKKINVYRNIAKTSTGTEPGDFLVKTRDIQEEILVQTARGSGVNISRINTDSSLPVRLMSRPKIAIYQSYLASMDEGWTRWVLDQFEFSYHILHNRNFNEKLLSRYQVIIFPDLNRKNIVDGTYTGYWSYFISGSPPEYQGGIGKKGLQALKQFVKKGGTVILMDSASEIGITDFSLPFSNTLKGVKEEQFYCPGSLLRLKVNSTDPLGWGFRPDSFIFFSHSPAFRTRPPMKGSINRKVVAGFNSTGSHLLSGYLKGEDYLNRAVMIIRFDYYKGNVIVLGGRIQHRAQTTGTFKFLFNSLYYSDLEN